MRRRHSYDFHGCRARPSTNQDPGSCEFAICNFLQLIAGCREVRDVLWPAICPLCAGGDAGHTSNPRSTFCQDGNWFLPAEGPFVFTAGLLAHVVSVHTTQHFVILTGMCAGGCAHDYQFNCSPAAGPRPKCAPSDGCSCLGSRWRLGFAWCGVCSFRQRGCSVGRFHPPVYLVDGLVCDPGKRGLQENVLPLQTRMLVTSSHI